MIILGIDWGEKKIGLAIASSFLAEPLEVIRVANGDEAIVKIKQTVDRERVDKLVVGVSEGESAEEARKFGADLQNRLGIDVDFEDETLTSQDAQALAVKAKIGRKKRKELEDAYAACVMLQSYLEKHA